MLFVLGLLLLAMLPGHPVFIARAVQLGRAVPLEVISQIPAVPHSPTLYATHHPERIKKFPFEKAKVIEAPEAPAHSDSYQWRHELDHDVESVFLAYCILCYGRATSQMFKGGS